MAPFLVRDKWEALALCVGFSTVNGSTLAVLVRPNGEMYDQLVEDVVVERPNSEFPIGYGRWSRVEAEQLVRES